MTLATAACAVASMAATAAHAQDYPSRRITFVAPAWPGTMSDRLARIVAEHLSARNRLGQPIVVEDRPGARSFLGYDRVAGAPPDGYTILLVSQQVSLPKEMAPSESFDPAKLTPLGRLASSPFVVAVSPRVPATTLQELVAHARAQPDSLNYGVIPNSTMQLGMLQFSRLLRAPLTEVPFRSIAPLVTSLLGNHIQMSFLSDFAIPHIQAGKLRALAVTSRTRWSRLPEVPGMAELGIDFESGFWYGVAVPSATPPTIQHRLVRELGEVMNLREVREAVVRLGMEPLEPSLREIAQHIQRESTQAEAGLKLYKERAAMPEDAPRGSRTRERRNGQPDVPGGL